MISQSYIDAFISKEKENSQCSKCGLCLQKCPVMKMGKKESKKEMSFLLNSEEPERVLKECTFCYSCNQYCPEGLKPYALIMERMVEKNRREGKTIPPSAEYMMTGKSDSGFFYDLYENGSDEDKNILDQWDKVPSKAEDVLFVGCYGRSVPKGIENSKTLEKLPKFAPRSACCGEIAHRYGDYDYFTKTVGRTYQQLCALDTKRLVCYCGSCSNYLGNVWPNYHGVKLPFKVISLYEWIWEKYNAGEISVKKSFAKDMVVADSCYSSELGDNFYEALRGLHEAVGARVVEMENNRYNALCCGFATSIRNDYDHVKSAAAGKNKFKQILETQTKNVSANCPGCWASINGIAKENKVELNIHYSINFILRAFGDEM